MNLGTRRTVYLGLLAMIAALAISGCREKRPLPYPPGSGPGDGASRATPAPIPPSIGFTAEPNSVPYGASTTLTWSTTNSDEVTIVGVGRFPPQGSAVVKPEDSREYRAVAKGPGGTTEAVARVEVTGKPAPGAGSTDLDGGARRAGVDERTLEEQIAEIFRTEIKDIFFDFDRSDLRDADKDILRANGKVLMEKIPKARVVIEGHCDERGSEEYNLALGDKRATAVRDFLVSLGVDAARLKTISYGKEKPLDPGQSEDAFSKNRRAHFLLVK